MKKIISIIASLVFLMFYSNAAFAAGDEANIKKLSSFKKTGVGRGEVIEQDTQFRANVAQNIFYRFRLKNYPPLYLLIEITIVFQ